MENDHPGTDSKLSSGFNDIRNHDTHSTFSPSSFSPEFKVYSATPSPVSIITDVMHNTDNYQHFDHQRHPIKMSTEEKE